MRRPYLARNTRSVVTGALPDLEKITTEDGITYYNDKYLSREIEKYSMIFAGVGLVLGVGGTVLIQRARK